MGVLADGANLYHPDVMATCDPAGDSSLSRTKPCLIIEVLAPSTRSIDERETRVAYFRIPAMHDYLIVNAEDRMVDHHRREDDGVWSWTGAQQRRHLPHVVPGSARRGRPVHRVVVTGGSRARSRSSGDRVHEEGDAA